MNVRYYGLKTTDCFGEKLKRAFQPIAQVSYTEEEEALAIARIDFTNYRYDSFDGFSQVYVIDRQDYQDFMEKWKEAKRMIKKEDVIA